MVLQADMDVVVVGAVLLFGVIGVFACHTGLGAGLLAQLPKLRDYRSRRVSSYDVTGGNHDWTDIQAGKEQQIADIAGPGCIKHIWMTIGGPEGALPDAYPRRIVLKMFWEDSAQPSVECPIGDFFGLGHGILKDFTSVPLQLSPQEGKAMNCWWAMPFNRRARIAILNECDKAIGVYFYIDYEAYPAAQDDITYFHVQWRRENPTQGWGDEYGRIKGGPDGNMNTMWQGGDPRSLNTTGDGNYVMLDAEGDGIYCGAHLDVDVFERQKHDWYGEGDDMIFIDGEPWPPSLHGTGTEDWFNCAFCPSTEYNAPFHGIILYNGTKEWPWQGKQSVYRYHIQDPIRFRRSIRATIEHGHANKLFNDYSSTAYYYLTTPKRGGPPLPPMADCLPRPNEPAFAPHDDGH